MTVSDEQWNLNIQLLLRFSGRWLGSTFNTHRKGRFPTHFFIIKKVITPQPLLLTKSESVSFKTFGKVANPITEGFCRKKCNYIFAKFPTLSNLSMVIGGSHCQPYRWYFTAEFRMKSVSYFLRYAWWKVLIFPVVELDEKF